MMTEFLLSEIGRRPTSDSSTHDREGFTLSCGLALGMVNLCKGREDMSGLADLRIVERLMKYLVGGRDSDEFQRRRDVSDRASAGFGHGDQEKTSRIFEGDSININVTAPGATLAIGLIFMRSG
jgi:anaphase-promoting complex subunit 1